MTLLRKKYENITDIPLNFCFLKELNDQFFMSGNKVETGSTVTRMQKF